MRHYSLRRKMTSIFLSISQRKNSNVALQTVFAIMTLFYCDTVKLFSSVHESL